MDSKNAHSGKKSAGGTDKLNGVSCCVADCKYHGAANACCANSIDVQNENAHRKAETFCSTFTPRAH